MSALQLLLGATGLLAGFAGTWSPCGFSMVDTLSAAREDERATLALCLATFAAGALAAACALFGGLSELGAVLHPGNAGTALAVAVAACAAVADIVAVRLRPQIRRQVPEPWRRTMPLPLATGLYGVLLGLGFTTFVLTVSTVALAAICVALGEPALGLAVGVGFGLGRAMPVVVLAPVAERELGIRAVDAMAQRPVTLRAVRLAGGVLLAVGALSIATGEAHAAIAGSDPSTGRSTLAWQPRQGPGMLRADGRTSLLGGTDPAVGGPYVAWHNGDRVTVVRRTSLAPVLDRRIAGVEELAVSSRWLAYRRATRRGERISVLRLPAGRPARRLLSVRSPSRLSRPDLEGNRLVVGAAGRRGSLIARFDLRRHRRATLARSRSAQLLNPSFSGHTLLYERVTVCGQQLVLRRGRHARVLMTRGPTAGTDSGADPGHTHQGSGTGPCPFRRPSPDLMWSTALSPRNAYLTLLHNGRPRIVRIRR